MASTPAPTPRLQLLGSPALRLGDSTVRLVAERRFQLLALLGLQAGHWLPRDSLAALLWPEHPPAAARRNLRKVVFDARSVPGAQTLEVADDALRWPVASDLQAFEQALRERRHADALALGGPALLVGIDDAANAAFSHWLVEQRNRVAEAWQHAAHGDQLLRGLAEVVLRMRVGQRLHVGCVDVRHAVGSAQDGDGAGIGCRRMAGAAGQQQHDRGSKKAVHRLSPRFCC